MKKKPSQFKKLSTLMEAALRDYIELSKFPYVVLDRLSYHIKDEEQEKCSMCLAGLMMHNRLLNKEIRSFCLHEMPETEIKVLYIIESILFNHLGKAFYSFYESIPLGLKYPETLIKDLYTSPSQFIPRFKELIKAVKKEEKLLGTLPAKGS